MKITIEYSVNTSDPDMPCIAYIWTPKGSFTGLGKTWRDAKEKVLTKIKQLERWQAPQPEEIDL